MIAAAEYQKLVQRHRGCAQNDMMIMIIRQMKFGWQIIISILSLLLPKNDHLENLVEDSTFLLPDPVVQKTTTRMICVRYTCRV
jgi:hypothetical protein